MNYFTMNHIIMRKSLFFVVVVIFSQFLVAKSDEPPCIICGYIGEAGQTGYKFSIDDVPDRCGAIWYTYYFFDNPLYDADNSAIKHLVDAGKPVIVSIGFLNDNHWDEMVDCLDNNQYIGPLEKFLKDYKISGIFLDHLGLFSTNRTDYPNKLNELISKIKTDVPSLKYVGIAIDAYLTSDYGNPSHFDFPTLNPNVDMYMIDGTTIGRICDKGVLSIQPITGSYPNTITWELVVKAISSSNLDKSKLIVNFALVVNMVSNGFSALESYSKYCSRSNSTQIWCANSIQIIREEVEYVKKVFKRIMFSSLDYDDVEEKCGCGPFIIANTFIDAFQSKPVKPCDTICGQ